MTHDDNLRDFADARLGLFIHYGLYSLLGRGEWALNREAMPVTEYKALADRFTAEAFDAQALVGLAKRAGARYVTFTTMHHDGFALYDSQVNPFNTANTACGRDLVAEVVEACRAQGLRVHLYHSLNHWTTQPDGVAALASQADQQAFVDFAHARIAELLERFNPIDCLWYDGWWPFNAQGWRAQEMNALARSIQPHLLVNGRNGLPGDFATPEGHMGAPRPHRPWEACITHNRNWGFHAGDHHFKSSADVLDLLLQAAAGAGNLLINVGPDGAGKLPAPSVAMLDDLAGWMALHGQAIHGSQPMTFDLQTRHDSDRSDWFHHGRCTTRGHTLHVALTQWPGPSFSLAGLQNRALSAKMLHDGSPVSFTQSGGRVTFTGLSDQPPTPLGGVIALACDGPPALYRTGGLSDPAGDHPRYDPCPSDIQH